MIIGSFIDEFIKKSTYASYEAVCADILTGGQRYSLNSQAGYTESEYLPENIRASVRSYTRDKDKAVELYRDFVFFLSRKGVNVKLDFPPVRISSSFDRQVFIAKYLQNPDAHIGDLEDILWVSPRTIESDLRSLKGEENPISVGGRTFYIPEMERDRGRVRFASTAHPLFLTQNLTQVLVMLKGLRKMAEDPLYERYATETAADIWNQLSQYAKDRIRFVLNEILPEDLVWYQNLSGEKTDTFYTEVSCSTVTNRGVHALLDCMKNGKEFWVEYSDNGRTVIYANCIFIKGSYAPERIDVDCSSGRKELRFENVIRSAYTAEALAAD